MRTIIIAKEFGAFNIISLLSSYSSSVYRRENWSSNLLCPPSPHRAQGEAGAEWGFPEALVALEGGGNASISCIYL